MSIIRREQLITPLSASYALTASYAENAGASIDTGSLVTTSSFNAYTASINNFTSSINAFTASYNTGSFTGSFTGSLFGTSSWSLSSSQALTASSADQFNIRVALTASGLIYPTVDNGEESFIQTDGNGNLSLQYVKTIYEEIVNGESTQLVKGTPVYVSGSQGASSIVFRADPLIPSKMPAVYIVADTLNVGGQGKGIALGLIKGIDTTGYPAGTEIYLAPGGGWTSIRPTGSAIVQVLGYVTKEGNGGQGVILNPGPVTLPNLLSGSVWVGNNNSVPVATLTSSLSVASASVAQNAVSASYALTASYALNGGGGGSGAKNISIYAVKSDFPIFTGDGKSYFSISPDLNNMNLTACGATTFLSSSSGTPTIQIARGRQSSPSSSYSYVDMLSTRITIDVGEYDSQYATTPPVIDTNNDDVLEGDIIRVDVDVAGTGTEGLLVRLTFN